MEEINGEYSTHFKSGFAGLKFEKSWGKHAEIKHTFTHTHLEVNTQIPITWNRYVCLHIHISGGNYRNNCCLEQICSHKCIYAHNWWISTQTPIMGNRYIHLYTHMHTPGGKYTNMYDVEQICSPKCTHTYTPGSKYTNAYWKGMFI